MPFSGPSIRSPSERIFFHHVVYQQCSEACCFVSRPNPDRYRIILVPINCMVGELYCSMGLTSRRQGLLDLVAEIDVPEGLHGDRIRKQAQHNLDSVLYPEWLAVPFR